MAEDAAIELRGRDHPWVSRGGIKLAHALDHFSWDVTDAVAMDVGSSTGGFTDVLLTKGAARVYAVDSGTNQLAWKFRQGDRVIVQIGRAWCRERGCQEVEITVVAGRLKKKKTKTSVTTT